MRESTYIDKRKEINNLSESDFYNEEFNSINFEKMDSSSLDSFRKLAFVKLVDASKKHHIEKIQGQDVEVLEKTKRLVTSLYSDYKLVKNWTKVK